MPVTPDDAIECPTCNGSGHCPGCGGKPEAAEACLDDEHAIYAACDGCDGSGECFECNGTGISFEVVDYE